MSQQQQQQQHQHTVLITGLPADGTSENDVRQFITFCGEVDSLYLFLAHQMSRAGDVSTSSSSSSSSSSAALVCFRNASSVAYAELLSGSLYQGKVIEVRRSSVAEAQQTLFTSKEEPVADGPASAPSNNPTLSTNAADAVGEDTPETMTGLWVRARMQRAAKAMWARADDVAGRAREGVAKVKHGALSLEVRAAHALHDVREMREWVPVYGNGPTGAQYDYTPTQPQWGERPAWVRAPRKE